MHCGVPTASFTPFRTSEAPPVYQPCPPSLSVPQKPLLCTNYAPHLVPYLRSPSRVPTVSLHPFPYLRSPSRVPTVPLHPVPYRRSPSRVPTVPLHPVPYRRSPSRVPTVPLTPFRTSGSPPVYQPCPPSRSVPQKPLPCTNYAPSRSVPQDRLLCTNYALTSFCAENQPLNRTLLTILGEWQSFVFVCA